MKIRFTLILCLFVLFLNSSSYSNTLLVGKNYSLKMPSDASKIAKAGDTILIDSDIYNSDEAKWSVDNLVIKCPNGIAQITAPAVIQNQKAIWVISGNNYTIENIKFSGAAVPDLNGAGIRQEGTNLTVSHCIFQDNQDGILAGANIYSTIIIEFCEFNHNGAGDGYSHNLYIGNIGKLIFQFNYTHRANIGHNLKSRANSNYILYNRIMDENEGNSSYLINLPDGGESYIIGNIMMKGPNAQNRSLIDYGSESLKNPNSALFVINNTLESRRNSCTYFQTNPNTIYTYICNNLLLGVGDSLTSPTTVFYENNLHISKSYADQFKDLSKFDYHLLENSQALSIGIIPNTLNTNFSLIPEFEYKYDADSISRQINNTIDLGAFQFSRQTKDLVETSDDILNIYPNPASNILNIEDNNINGNTIEIYSLLGEKIYDKPIDFGNNHIKLDNFQTGIYFIKINKDIKTFSIVK